MKNLKKKQLIEAIEKTRGIKTAMCQMLGIASQKTLNGYLEREDLVEFLQNQNMITQDKVRHNIAKWIEEGNEKVTLWYAERQMYSEFGNKQTVINEVKHDFSKASDSELDEEIKKYE